MKTYFLQKIAFLAVGILLLSSCKDSKPQFIVEGTISNADTTIIYLERRSLTETTIIDSVKTDANGNFKFKQPSLGYPEFYLLRLGNQQINLAVDSTETITVKAAKNNFAIDYSIEGSNSTAQIKEIVQAQNKLALSFSELKSKYEKKEISQEQYAAQFNEAVEEYKTKAKNLILSDHNSLAAYFALFQQVEGYLIFDPYDKKDIPMFQSVATVWDQYKSESPRAAQLKDFTLAALAEVRRMANQEETLNKLINTESTDDSNYYEINLPDLKNKNISLSSLKGKVVLLDFTAYQTDFSPAHNIVLNNVYSKYKGNMEIYQVSFDTDIHAWQNSAVNLPWICVRDNQSLTSDLVSKFNIQGIPTTFLLNKNGELVKRLSPNDDVAREVQKLL